MVDEKKEFDKLDDPDEGDMVSFLEKHVPADGILFEVTTYGMACGPVMTTDYVLVSKGDE